MPAASGAAPRAEPGEAGPRLAVRPLPSPAGARSLCPNLAAGEDGRTYLSWIEERALDGAEADAEGAPRTGHALRISSAAGEPDAPWSEPSEVASGERWLVNWADFPGAAALADGTLAAYWFERYPNPEYRSGYYAYARLSEDGGATWSAPIRIHEDRSPVEHGFVTALALDHARFGLFWLDGRAGKEVAFGRSGHAGPTGLLFRTLDASGRLGEEVTLDERVCDCCQTDAVRVESVGPLVVYRDRDEAERRDVSATMPESGGWSAPRPVGRDAWRIPGCPVNGPRAATAGRRVAVARYTEGDDTLRPGRPAVLVELSRDAGGTFEPLGVADDGAPLGRVDAAMLADGTLIVTWLERVAGAAEWRARAFAPDGTRGPSVTIAETTPMREAGFARLAPHATGARVAWTDPSGPAGSAVRTARIELR